MYEVEQHVAYRDLKIKSPRSVIIIFFYAMFGAFTDIDWISVPTEFKEELVSSMVNGERAG